MMHALIVSCVFPPEPVVSAQTSAQIAEALVLGGHTVTVVTTFPNRPAGKLFPGFSRRLWQRDVSASGIEIIRCFATLSPTSRLLSRLMENLTFGLSSGWHVLTMRRPDVIYANTWPIVATGILFLIAKLRRIPLVISIQDVYPEALIAQQRMSGDSLLARLMRRMDAAMARHSAHVIVISERFAEIYQKQRHVLPEKLSLIPNWIDGKHIDASITREQVRQHPNIAVEDFLLVYGGNIGAAAGVETIIEAMQLLEDVPNVKLLVAGSGSRLAACQQLAQIMSTQSIVFHSPWAAEETSEILRAADVLMLPTQHQQSLVSVPSKLLSYMLAERPVLATAASNSDLADLVHRAQCGWVVEPGRPDLLAMQIKEIMRLDPAERQQRGCNGRAYVLQHFTKDTCLPKVLRILEDIAQ